MSYDKKTTTFFYKSKEGSQYKIGLEWKKTKNEDLIMLLYSYSKIDDFLGSNFSEVASYLYKKAIKPLNQSPESIKWLQMYKGYNGFKDSFEIIEMYWHESTQKYVLSYRRTLSHEERIILTN